MTYFGFLTRFIGIPLAILAVLTWWDIRQGRHVPTGLHHQAGWLAVLLHVIAAVVWTTPWDNYLVATGVWYYDPALVTGITIGWVPIEEYTFFVVQTVMTGMWLLWLARRIPLPPLTAPPRPKIRAVSAAIAGVIWLAAAGLGLSQWRPGTYLALELGWLLPPIILQLVVGADMLWHHRRLVAAALIVPWIYLTAADFLAVGWGNWTIAPSRSTGIMIGGVLPIEEVIFFLLTNMLIVFGMTLFLAPGFKALRGQLLGAVLRVTGKER